MEQTDLALVVKAPGTAEVRPVSAVPGPVALRTIYSGISLGTELTFLKGTNPAFPPA